MDDVLELRLVSVAGACRTGGGNHIVEYPQLVMSKVGVRHSEHYISEASDPPLSRTIQLKSRPSLDGGIGDSIV